jgi:hypothetical protein
MWSMRPRRAESDEREESTLSPPYPIMTRVSSPFYVLAGPGDQGRHDAAYCMHRIEFDADTIPGDAAFEGSENQGDRYPSTSISAAPAIHE